MPGETDRSGFAPDRIYGEAVKTTLSEWTRRPTWRDVYLGPIPGAAEKLAARRAEYPMTPTEGGAVKCPDGCWQCFFCRTINAGKFCEECGRPRPIPDER